MFPTINHIDEMLAAIEGRTEFRVKHDEERGYKVVNYVVALQDTFPDVDEAGITPDEIRRRQLLREARGITFCADTGKVVARKFFKFFNLGERPETDPTTVDFSKPHVILEKLDGSMITPYLKRDGTIEFHSKMGNTFLTPLVGEFVKNHPQYEAFARQIISNGFTPIFEFCSRQQRIVIDYPEDRLVLLAIRDNLTGQYMDYDSICQNAMEYLVEHVRALPGSIENIRTFMEEVHDLQGEEGYVVCFDAGLRLKMKAAEYIRMHRAKDSLAHEKNVLFLVASDTIDDVIALLSEEDQQKVREYADAVGECMLVSATVAEMICKKSADLDQKTFAIEVAGKTEGPMKSVLFQVRKGADAFDTIKSTVKNHCSTQSAVDSIRSLIGATWDYYGVAE